MLLSSIRERSRRAGIVIPLSALAIYLLVFLILSPEAKNTAPILSVIPVIAVGWTHGLRAGLLAAVLTVPLNTALMNVAGRSGWDALIRTEGGVLGTIGIVAVGAAVGRLRDLGGRLQKELSERQRIEQALRENQAKYRIMAEESLAGVFILQDDKFRYVNQALANIFGYSPSDIEDQMGPLDLMQPDEKLYYGEQGGGQAPIEIGEMRYRTFRGLRKDGSLIHCEVRAGPVEMSGGQAILGTMVDITERKRIEQAEKDFTRMKNELVLGISRGMRDPLHALRGFLKELQKGIFDNPIMPEMLISRAVTDADRLTNIVDNLLDMAQLESGDFELDLEEVDVSELVRGVLRALEGEANLKHVAMEHVLPRQPLTAMVDRGRLRQVLVNLVDNAIKFSKSGGTVVVSGGLMWDKILTIQVSDRGVGIPQDELLRVFDKFPGVGANVTDAGGGPSLGLYISKHIVEAHRGQINVESKPGKGSTFYFSIPQQGSQCA